MRVIVTRPQNEAPPWVQALLDAGHAASSLPLISVGPVSALQPLQDAWRRIAEWDALMFVSRNAVEQFFKQKPPLTRIFTAQAAIKCRAFVPGPGSAAALLAAGADPEWIDGPDAVSGQWDSEALWRRVQHLVVPGFRLLIVRGTSLTDGAVAEGHAVPADAGVGRDWLAQQAVAAGAQVEFVVAYARQAPVFDDGQKAMAQAAAHDGSVWLFSSSEAVANLLRSVPGHTWQDARALVTHPRIGQAARAAGFGHVQEVHPALPAILASIESLQ
ncbi:MAG: uroporphyrinogen-III synthase [Rhodoferax sp.]|nr:uroporphyrinogen-III synthase [Rhodoferax sp.]